MGVISKIIITDKRGYVFVVTNNVLDDSEDDLTIIQKSLSEIANSDDPSLYQLEKKKGIVYVGFIGKN